MTIATTNKQIAVTGSGVELRYTTRLLRDLGYAVIDNTEQHDAEIDNLWVSSGLNQLTGYPDQPLDRCPIPVAAFAQGALTALKTLASDKFKPTHNGAELLTLRAAITGETRKGDISVGESCRFLKCADGVIAINLARDCDWELVPAWLLSDVAPTWHDVEQRVAELSKSHLIEQGRLLGLAVTDAAPTLPDRCSWYKVSHKGASVAPKETLKVVDLSSLWAGPLCSQLLRWAGADVIKVESTQRPDGARRGSPKFFKFLNNGKSELALDFKNKSDIDKLLDLIRSADIVIEASRPRALQQLGIIAEDLVNEVAGLTWLSLTGYGREEPQGNWIAYGDDAGVAGGLSAEIYKATGKWMFCGDAIADPLTGLHAALAGYASWQSGGGKLLSLSLVQTIQHCVLSARRMERR